MEVTKQIKERSPSKTFFNPNKEQTHSFFKQTKVGSCSHVLVKNGQSLAVPFGILNERGRGLNHFKTVPEKSAEVKSVYMKDYTPKPFMHVGMGKKPLVEYDPNSYRNRLPIGGIVMGMKNKSLIEIGDGGLVNRKQWRSTARDSFRWPTILPISNPGITSDMSKRVHQKLEMIN